MIDPIFFQSDGTPETGKIPVQVTYTGGGDYAEVIGAVKSRLAAFHANLKLGILRQLRQRYALPEGGYVDFTHMYGVTQAIVTLKKEEEDKTPFYGGILIRPTVHNNLALYLNDPSVSYLDPDLTPVFADRSVPTDIKTRGKITGLLSGRPFVPGTLDTDETEWLVVQISKTKKLTANESIKSGAVKIFRIKDPKHGGFVESNRKRRYLLSAASNARFANSLIDPSKPAAFSEFYLCGKKVTSLPAIAGASTGDSRSQGVRIRTISMRFPSFERAAEAKGIVIVAMYERLFAIDTRVVPAPTAWTLLDTDTSGIEANDYGHDFTETRRDDGAFVLTCSGTNGAGKCSGFEVVVAKATTPGGPPVITGTLKRVALEFTPALSASTTGRKAVSYSVGPVSEAQDANPVLKIDLGPDTDAFGNLVYHGTRTVDWMVGIRHVVSNTTMSFSYQYLSGRARIDYDKFAGGLIPQYPRVEINATWSKSVAASLVTTPFVAKGTGWTNHDGSIGIVPVAFVAYYGGGPLYHPEDGNPYYMGSDTPPLDSNRPRLMGAVFQWDEDRVGTITISGGFAGYRSITNSYSRHGAVIDGELTDLASPRRLPTGYTPAPIVDTVGLPGVTGGSYDKDPVNRYAYPGMDHHTNQLAWRSDGGRFGTWIANAPAIPGIYSPASGLTDFAGPFELKVKLVDKLLNERFGWDNFLANFTGTIVSSGAQTFLNDRYVGSIPDETLVGPATPTLGTTTTAGDTHTFSSAFGGYATVTGRFFERNGFGSIPIIGESTGPVTFTPLTLSSNFSRDTSAEQAPADFTRAAWVAVNPGTQYSDPTYQPSIQYVISSTIGPAWGQFAESVTLEGRAKKASLRALDDILLRDLRTGGYVTQLHWRAAIVSGPTPTTVFQETYIGNDKGAVLLKDVLNEWKKLGEVFSPLFDKVFINHPIISMEVALI